jgi:hypothetical protein
MKSLLEIEQAIARLPKKSQRQLVRDIPVLCAEVFPTDGWEAILADATPRPGFASLLDKLAVNEDSLSERK